MNNGSVSMAGSVVWHDLITTEVEPSLEFYRELLGWTYSTKDLGGYGTYHLINGSNGPLGGFMKPIIPDVPPHWSAYVSVPDIEATLKKVEELRGRVIIGPLDLPDLGRFAVTVDPDGAAINIFTPLNGGVHLDAKPKRGEFCWNECIVNDVGGEREYYSKLFDWKFKQMSLSKPSSYWVASCNNREVAGMMAKPVDVPSPPHWLTYVLVENLKETLSSVERLGGRVLVGEIKVAEIGICAVIQDRVGAVLGLFSHSL